jgi:hypothetical protein
MSGDGANTKDCGGDTSLQHLQEQLERSTEVPHAYVSKKMTKHIALEQENNRNLKCKMPKVTD